MTKTREDLHWCLEQLESMSSSRSVSDLASAKFKRLLSRELNNIADSRQIRDYIESFQDNTLEFDLVTLAAGLESNAEMHSATGQSDPKGSAIPTIDGMPLRRSAQDETQQRAYTGSGQDWQSFRASTPTGVALAIGSALRLSVGAGGPGSGLPNSISSPAISQILLQSANRAAPSAPRACSIAVTTLHTGAGNWAASRQTPNGGISPDLVSTDTRSQMRPEALAQVIPAPQGTRTPISPSAISTPAPSINISMSDPPPITIVPPSPAQSHSPSPAQSHSPSPSSTYNDLTVAVPNGCVPHTSSAPDSSVSNASPSSQLSEKTLTGPLQQQQSPSVYGIPAGFINECSPLHLIGPAISFLSSGIS